MSDLKPIIEQSFTQYAGAVIQSRALVDVRDCLKPSARQIFYCLYTDKFISSKPYKKTLKALGSLARLYIHGDSSAIGVMMRAGQPFAMRYPLMDIHGNGGTLIASGNWAAARYTESRLAEITNSLFEDIAKDTIDDWRDNYDDTEKYPSVLPSKGFFNIVNGSSGIAVGAASSIPQYNLREINKALCTLLDNPDCDFDEIYCAPDFATGAILYNESDVKESMKSGIGYACKLRSVVDFDNKEHCLVVTEIPYGVYTNTICGQLEEIVNGEDNPGIERFNDLTGEQPLIKIYLSKKANPDKVLKYLFKNTSLQYHYGINFTMLDQGRYPRLFTWREILQAHIEHEIKVYECGYNYDLKKIKARLHILEGLLKAISMIDEVIKTIRGSSDSKSANVALQKLLDIDETQAKAILDIKLARLAHLEVAKLQKEKEELIKEKERIEAILGDKTLFNIEVKKGWIEIAQRYGDDRRTKILDISKDDEEPVETYSLQLSLTNQNNIFINKTSSLYAQKRGGVGSKFKLKNGEHVLSSQTIENIDTILVFTDKGNFYHCAADNLPIEEKIAVESIVNLNVGEKVRAITSFNQESSKQNIIFFTKNGYLKKSNLSEYNVKRNCATKALDLDNDDEICSVIFTNEENVGMLTAEGQFLIIPTKDIRSIGRVTKGVRGIKLNENDFLISAKTIPADTKELLSITAKGCIKRTPISDFGVQTRYTKGGRLHKVKDAGEKMADFMPISSEKEVLVTASTAQMRIKLTEIPLLTKGATGNKAMKMAENALVIALNKI